MKFINRLYVSLIILLYLNPLMGQVYHQPVFNGLEGEELVDSLLGKFKTYSLLPYSTCRDTLFSKIDGVNDSLECIYTGMKRYLPPGQDPTDAVLLNGQPNGINTEHSYPQSKGAEGYGRSDMHILYPARVRTNSQRVNNPFGDIIDNQTQIWYYKTNEMTAPPAVNRDYYSESTTTKFEPRESVKGNMARSIFYFFTFYNADAVSADPAFFDLQVTDLCKWHFEDPVDSVEWRRTFFIDKYQRNVNPFVLDCSLASRMYCQHISDQCLTLIHTSEIKKPVADFDLYPNPGSGEIYVRTQSDIGKYILYIKDIHGKIIFDTSGFMQGREIKINLPQYPGGLYFVYFMDEKNKTLVAKKFIHLN